MSTAESRAVQLLLAEVDRLRDALAFYGSYDAYERLAAGDPRLAGVEVGDPAVMLDRGSIARHALRPLPELLDGLAELAAAPAGASREGA